jgi:RND superfamily putative drug exporter
MSDRQVDRFVRFGERITQRRWGVALLWLLLAAGFGAFAPLADANLQGGGFDVAGSQSHAVAEILDQEFHSSTLTNAVVVYRSPTTVTDPEFARKAAAVDDRIRAVPGVAEVRSFSRTGDNSLVSRDLHTALSVVTLSDGPSAAQDKVPELREQATGAGIDAQVTSFPAIQYDTFQLSKDDLARTELITFPVVTLFLLLFFRTVVAALVPLALGGISVAMATGMLGILGGLFPVSVFALNIGSLIGLGLSIDFSLIMVRRFREERAAGRTVPDAVAASVATSGRSVLFSGLTLVVSMLAVTIIFADLMIVRSITLGVVLVSGIGLAAGLTLLPALLSILGDRIDRWRVIPRGRRRPAGSGPWYRLSMSVTRRPVAWLLLSIVALSVLSVPLLHLKLVGASTAALPASTESAQGAKDVEQTFGTNALNPIKITIQSDDVDGAFTPEFLAGLRQVSNTLAADPRVVVVGSLSTALADVPDDRFTQLRRSDYFSPVAAQYVNLGGRADTANLTVVPRAEMYDSEHQNFVTDLREQILPQLSGLQDYRVEVGGDAASFIDFKNSLYGRFPLVAAVISVEILVLLLLFFRSVLLPVKAAVTSALPLLAAYGVLVWLFQDGYGEAFLGFESQGRLNVVTPVIVFVILFALSTDYEVFLLSRVRENYQHSGNTEQAVALGLQQTAGLITAAALILIATFGSLGVSSVQTL